MNNIWLFLGPEIGLKQKTITNTVNKIQQTLAKQKNNEELERNKLYAKELEISSIALEIQSNSLFSQNRLFYIADVDKWTSKDAQVFLNAVQHIDDSTFIILTSDETKVTSTLDKAILKAQKKIFWPLKENDYISYLSNACEERGIQMHPNAIELIVYLVGDNTTELDHLLSQIIVYYNSLPKKDNDQQAIILREDIESWISHMKQETIFALFTELSASRYESVFSTLGALLQAGEHPIQLMAGLIYQIKNALHLKRRNSNGEDAKAVLVSLGVRSFTTQQEYIDFIDTCSVQAIQKMFMLCVHTEQLLRSHGNSQYVQIVLSQLIYNICMLHNNPQYEVSTGNIDYYYNKSTRSF